MMLAIGETGIAGAFFVNENYCQRKKSDFQKRHMKRS